MNVRPATDQELAKARAKFFAPARSKWSVYAAYAREILTRTQLDCELDQHGWEFEQDLADAARICITAYVREDSHGN